MPWGLPQTWGGASVSPQSCSPLPDSQLMGPHLGRVSPLPRRALMAGTGLTGVWRGRGSPAVPGNPMGFEEVTLVWGCSGEGKTDARDESQVREIVQGKRGSLCIWPSQVSVPAPHSAPQDPPERSPEHREPGEDPEQSRKGRFFEALTSSSFICYHVLLVATEGLRWSGGGPRPHLRAPQL